MRLRRYSLPLILCTFFLLVSRSSAQETYVLIGWNDLGMHCANQDFSKIAVLPPYNNVFAQLVKRVPGQLPEIVTSGYTVEYSIPNNTYSVGKTNFWSYAQTLFGLPNPLPPNIGLTGKGLTGVLDSGGTYFAAHGIPVTPFPDSDLVNESPFQLIHLVAKATSSGSVLATTDVVIPVSNEVGCVQSGCHASASDILQSHEAVPNFNSQGPVLCAACHASNALGTQGIPEAGPFSERIHGAHSSVAGPQFSINTCYKCHPGPRTQCLRDIMGKNPTNPLVCQNCHGTMDSVAASVANGRRPWLDEPKCGKCHGATYAEETGKLFRQSTGHGGLFCSACHGSPHAILPTILANDNLQNTRLQGFPGTLHTCSVCHSVPPEAPGPHGILDTTSSVAATPVLLSPANGLIGITRNPFLSWNPAAYAHVYTLQIATDSTFSPLVLEDTTLAHPSRQLDTLPGGQVYYWRVLARNDLGASAWSEIWHFTTGVGLTASYSVEKDWNMVSVPFQVSNPSMSAVFPSASSGAFLYQPGSGYLKKDSVQPGSGYWLKFPAAQTVGVTGSPITAETLSVASGWNLIGTVAGTIPASLVVSAPAAIIATNFYGYRSSYILADSLAPSKAYWVKTSSAGQLFLGGAAAGLAMGSPKTSADDLEGCDRLTVKDAEAHEQTIYMRPTGLAGRPASFYELPPLPPEGIFDVRFRSGRLLETYHMGDNEVMPILVSSAAYPLTVSWDIASTREPALSLTCGAVSLPMKGSGSARIEAESDGLAVVAGSARGVPREVTLDQNYPNPFNPSTTVRYGLPDRSHVRLSVYTLLGQKIEELVNGTQEAGYHEAVWSAETGSGLYLYKLEITNTEDPSKVFTTVRKMLLLR